MSSGGGPWRRQEDHLLRGAGLARAVVRDQLLPRPGSSGLPAMTTFVFGTDETDQVVAVAQ
jgi:hypothetical protein